MICRSSTQMSKRVPTTSMCVRGVPRSRRCARRRDCRTRCGCRGTSRPAGCADHVGQLDVRADGELADPVAVLVGVGVRPEILLAAPCSRCARRRGGCPSIVDASAAVARGRRTCRRDSRRRRRRRRRSPLTSPGVVKTSPPGRLPHLSGLMRPLVFSHL